MFLFVLRAAIGVMTAVDLTSSARAPGSTSGKTGRAEGVYRRRGNSIRVTAWAKMVPVTCTTIVSEARSSFDSRPTRRRTLITTGAAAEAGHTQFNNWQSGRGRSEQLRPKKIQLQSRRQQVQWQARTGTDDALVAATALELEP